MQEAYHVFLDFKEGFIKGFVLFHVTSVELRHKVPSPTNVSEQYIAIHTSISVVNAVLQLVVVTHSH